MRRAKSKASIKNVEELRPEVKCAAATPVDIVQVREQIRNEVGSCALEMVKNTITEVENGHYLAMKYLFEMVGLFPATVAEESGTQDSLAKILLGRLGIFEESNLQQEVGLQTKVTKHSRSPADESAGHTVE